MSNFNFNESILGGRISSDPEYAVTPSGIPVIRFNMAVNRPTGANGEQKADFFSVVAWRGNADFINKFFRKSSPICVRGTLETRTWTDNNGIKRYGIDLVADKAWFVDSKADNPAGMQAAPAYQNQYTNQYTNPAAGTPTNTPTGQYNTQTAPQFEELAGDEELPF